VDVAGKLCLDVGQSTGGFTDCLLQHGAARVVGLDVGHGQLHPHLRADARVACFEGVNARYLVAAEAAGDVQTFEQDAIDSEALGAHSESATAELDINIELQKAAPSGFDVLVADVSFISLTLLLPALAPLLAPGANVLLLVKPQFELQPEHIGKGGIVKDERLYADVQQRLRLACAALGWQVQQWLPSPIDGGDGNREFFVYAQTARTP
jgi:23S rRNA (cytidine1920-2'-O)/16S rRNA (cytidine1409-2'-O)-methyltransferase